MVDVEVEDNHSHIQNTFKALIALKAHEIQNDDTINQSVASKSVGSKSGFAAMFEKLATTQPKETNTNKSFPKNFQVLADYHDQTQNYIIDMNGDDYEKRVIQQFISNKRDFTQDVLVKIADDSQFSTKIVEFIDNLDRIMKNDNTDYEDTILGLFVSEVTYGLGLKIVFCVPFKEGSDVKYSKVNVHFSPPAVTDELSTYRNELDTFNRPNTDNRSSLIGQILEFKNKEIEDALKKCVKKKYEIIVEWETKVTKMTKDITLKNNFKTEFIPQLHEAILQDIIDNVSKAEMGSGGYNYAGIKKRIKKLNSDNHGDSLMGFDGNEVFDNDFIAEPEPSDEEAPTRNNNQKKVQLNNDYAAAVININETINDTAIAQALDENEREIFNQIIHRQIPGYGTLEDKDKTNPGVATTTYINDNNKETYDILQKDWVIERNQGGGDCLFRAIAQALSTIGLYNGENDHGQVRTMICNELLLGNVKIQSTDTAGVLENEELKKYVKHMHNPTIWGGLDEILAAEKVYSVVHNKPIRFRIWRTTKKTNMSPGYQYSQNENGTETWKPGNTHPNDGLGSSHQSVADATVFELYNPYGLHWEWIRKANDTR